MITNETGIVTGTRDTLEMRRNLIRKDRGQEAERETETEENIDAAEHQNLTHHLTKIKTEIVIAIEEMTGKEKESEIAEENATELDINTCYIQPEIFVNCNLYKTTALDELIHMYIYVYK